MILQLIGLLLRIKEVEGFKPNGTIYAGTPAVHTISKHTPVRDASNLLHHQAKAIIRKYATFKMLDKSCTTYFDSTVLGLTIMVQRNRHQVRRFCIPIVVFWFGISPAQNELLRAFVPSLVQLTLTTGMVQGLGSGTRKKTGRFRGIKKCPCVP